MKKTLTYLLPLLAIAALAAPLRDTTSVPKFLTPDAYTLHSGETANFLLTMDATVSSPTVVTLSSSDPGAFPVQSQVTVLSGHNTAVFSAQNVGYRPAIRSNVTVTASCNGSSQTAVISVVP